MYFQWKERYSLQIAEVDLQHQRLFELGDKLYYQTHAGDDNDHYDEIQTVLAELISYTKYHFNYEEDLLNKNNFPSVAEHKKEHDYFIEKINSIAAHDMEEDQLEIIDNLINFLSQWISSHIVFEDRKYADFLKAKGVS